MSVQQYSTQIGTESKVNQVSADYSPQLEEVSDYQVQVAMPHIPRPVKHALRILKVPVPQDHSFILQKQRPTTSHSTLLKQQTSFKSGTASSNKSNSASGDNKVIQCQADNQINAYQGKTLLLRQKRRRQQVSSQENNSLMSNDLFKSVQTKH